MKILRSLIFAPLLLAFTCDEPVLDKNDFLINTGILGSWEISSETIDGISDLTAKCCQAFDFYADKNYKDFKGEFKYQYELGVKDGVFTLFPEDQKINFKQTDGKEFNYSYSISEDQDLLTFTFSDSDRIFRQGWRRIY